MEDVPSGNSSWGGPGDLIPRQRVFAMQIAAGALLAGLLSFAAVSAWLGGRVLNNPGNGPPTGSILTWTSILFFLTALPTSLIMPARVAGQAIKNLAQGKPIHGLNVGMPVSEQLAAVWQGSVIVGLAFLEGAGIFRRRFEDDRGPIRTAGGHGNRRGNDVGTVSNCITRSIVDDAPSRVTRATANRPRAGLIGLFGTTNVPPSEASRRLE